MAIVKAYKTDFSVKETVRRMMYNYPTAFPTKSNCFNHLFLTIGNGYEWIHGCLVTNERYDPTPKFYTEDLGEILKNSNKGSDGREDPVIRDLDILVAKRTRFDHMRTNNRLRFIIEHFDDVFEDSIIFENPYPPINAYSKLFSMPIDVVDDWRMACDETSDALNRWIYKKRSEISTNNLDGIEIANKEFRQDHFEKEGARMDRIARETINLLE